MSEKSASLPEPSAGSMSGGPMEPRGGGNADGAGPGAGSMGTGEAAGGAMMTRACRHDQGAGNSAAGVTTTGAAFVPRPPLLPSAGAVIQAGAFGAALSGVTTAVSAAMLVKAGHMTTGEAVKDVSKAAVQGAATMAVASTVAHVVRARPMIGLAVLAVAGIGLFMMMADKKAKKDTARKASVPATTEAAEAGEKSTTPRRRSTSRKTA